MRFFFSYIRHHRSVIIVCALFCAIFAAVFALYHITLAAVIYPTLLCAMLGIVLLVIKSVFAARKHRWLEQALSFPAATLEDMLPPAGNIDDEDYQQIIRKLCAEQASFAGQMNLRYEEMVDYYTVWVHQIKTPIAAMRLTLQNEDTPVSRRLGSDLFRIEQYVGMVLTFLRLDGSSTDYLIREYPLDGIVRQAVRKFAGEFISRKLTLTYEPLNTTVVTDEKWLVFVIEQLLSNALKYTPRGGVFIEMCRPRTLCIRDTGMGIAPDDLPRIFEKGFTGGNGRSDKKATGLGLYLCRRICANLNLSISAESAPDMGTAMYITFPEQN